ncbi:hypothetical protein CH373_12540 [Leptospira perolatii]|uniref:Metal-dependent HD superfamily phosphohydrolase n=1 Tax=Leptospira perolatii TaxID=2023191 RepID=A0A2M9ZLH3_9LEPT|nr:hypothetical protein [Leptospira perolatii]PJZ70237.1 hypothetical protein CH360_06430 [Leptospira perolatii]PJZ72879.1 hypothetical protein CH373_12540 [Leptospira perolatii]
MLRQKFLETVQKYEKQEQLIETIWQEVVQHYSEPNRFYHNLSHIENLTNNLSQVKSQIQDWDTVLFSIVYHDIVYDVSATDNEEKSAELAEARLRSIHYPEDSLRLCSSQIVATKGHSNSDNSDTKLFLDADLSILGENSIVYSDYCQNIRKEYSIYSDGDYKAGRMKVLHYFLTMDRIYKTDYFYEKYEKQARKNIKQELDELSSQTDE